MSRCLSQYTKTGPFLNARASLYSRLVIIETPGLAEIHHSFEIRRAFESMKMARKFQRTSTWEFTRGNTSLWLILVVKMQQ